jgi:phage recombination protein Bet
MSAIVVRQDKPTSLVERFAGRYFVDADKLLSTLKATAFSQRPDKSGKVPDITNERMMALLVVADQYKLNPFTKEIYAYPDKYQGIVPVVGVDGWSRIINENPALDGIEFRYSDKLVTMDKAKPCPEWCEVVIRRKDRNSPIVVREYLDEVFRNIEYVSPWQTHTKRMLRHKTLIQGARIAFGFAGIYDEDEAERIIEMGDAEVVSHRIPANAGAGDDLTAAVKQVVQDTAALIRKAFAEGRELDAYMQFVQMTQDGDDDTIGKQLYLWSLLNSKERAAIKRTQVAERKAESGEAVDADVKELESR